MRIPRIIHQIYLQGTLPPRLQAHVQSIKGRNPDWEHRLYDLQAGLALIREHFSDEILQAFELINPEYGAARADFLRHLIIYQYGGVYLDIKSDVIWPLSEVIRDDDEYIISQWDNGPGEAHNGFGLHPELAHVPGGEFQTHFLIARERHPLSKAAIEAITQNIFNYGPWSGVGKMGVIRTTGPSAYTLALYPKLAAHRHRFSSEREIGSMLSISDYAHMDVFRRHYSSLKTPVIKLTKTQRLLQVLFEWVRTVKHVLKQFIR